MDYMATTAPKRWITRANRGLYDATTTDHFPLVLTLVAKNAMSRSKREYPPFAAKQIGWQQTEFTYNDDIRVKVGMEHPIEVAEVMHSAYHVYTDGSYTGARNTHARSLRPKQRKARGDV